MHTHEHNISRPVFKRYGRSVQLAIQSAADLHHILSLDEALWLSTSAPQASLRSDKTLLNYLDVDADQRIKAGELKECIRWTLGLLQQTQGLDQRSTTLVYDTLNLADATGKSLGNTFLKIGRTQQISSGELSLKAIREQVKTLEMQAISGGGVLLPDAAGDPDMQEFLLQAIQVTEPATHPSGRTGIQLATLKRLIDSIDAYEQWLKLGDTEHTATTLPFNDETAACYQIVEKLRQPLDHFFACCRALSFNPGLKKEFWPPDMSADAPQDAAALAEYLSRAPVAEPAESGRLTPSSSVNPHYQDALAHLLTRVASHALKQPLEALTVQEWTAIKEAFVPYAQWQHSKKGAEAEALGIEKIEAFHTRGLREKVEALIKEAAASALALSEVQALEKLALFQGHLLDICNNIVSCPELYDPQRRALFEEGTLIMDGRRFNLAVMVPDRKEHAAITSQNSMFVLYARIQHAPSGHSMDIAVPVTAGTQGNLSVGKRGIFQHVDGTEWTAQISEIVDRPVSLREAAIAPFIRLGAVLTGKIEAITSSAEKDLDRTGSSSLEHLSTGTGQPQQSSSSSSLVRNGGLIAGGGIALAALGSSFAFITKTLADMHWWQIITGLLAAVLAVMIPSIILAALRLRKRDLSCILEGSGWAVNSRMRLTRSQRMAFTSTPDRPEDSEIEPGNRRWIWWTCITLLILALGFRACPQADSTTTDHPAQQEETTNAVQ